MPDKEMYELERRYSRKLSFSEILSAFPDSMPLINEKIKEFELEKKSIIENIEKKMRTISKLNNELKLFFIEVIRAFDGDILKSVVEKIKRLSLLKKMFEGQTRRYQNYTVDVEQAKRFPIENFFLDTPKMSNGKKFFRCPFHDERTPSFCVYPDNHFYCFGCEENGDSIDFCMKFYGIDFKSSIGRLI